MHIINILFIHINILFIHIILLFILLPTSSSREKSRGNRKRADFEEIMRGCVYERCSLLHHLVYTPAYFSHIIIILFIHTIILFIHLLTSSSCLYSCLRHHLVYTPAYSIHIIIILSIHIIIILFIHLPTSSSCVHSCLLYPYHHHLVSPYHHHLVYTHNPA